MVAQRATLTSRKITLPTVCFANISNINPILQRSEHLVQLPKQQGKK